MEELLKTKEDVQFVRAALASGRNLDKAEKVLREKTPYFELCVAELSRRFNLNLWGTINDTYYWIEGDRERNSVIYPSREDALRALLDEKIEWTD